MTLTSRRQFNQLTLAALTGSILGCSSRQPEKAPDAKTTSDGTKPAATAAAKTYDENLLLVGDPHVCRGLNQCKNQGKTKHNDCAGQGACATAEMHSCDGLNSCKGQGGCDDHPGQNQCKGQGACAVTITKDATWQKARAKFAELMTKQGKKFGPAPAKG